MEILRNAFETYPESRIKFRRKFIIIITYSYYLSDAEPLFINLKIIIFKNNNNSKIGLQMYKYHTNTLPAAIMELSTANYSTHNSTTGNTSGLKHTFGTRVYMYIQNLFEGCIYLESCCVYFTNK